MKVTIRGRGFRVTLRGGLSSRYLQGGPSAGIPGRTGSKWTILIVFSGLESGAAAHNKLGEFLALAYLSKPFGIKSQNVSALICSRSMLFRCGLAHNTSILTSCMTHEPARSYCTKRWQLSANVAQT